MRATIAAMACAMLTGCGGYALRGHVVEGPESYIEVVSAKDPRLAGPPVEGARLRFTADPRSLGKKPLGNTVSRGDGQFEMSVDLFGAGALDYELGILALADGFRHAEDYLPMPGGDKRLLIVLAKGRSTYRPEENPAADVERYYPKRVR